MFSSIQRTITVVQSTRKKKCYVSIHFIENGGFQLVELWDWERAQNLEEIPIILSF